MNPIEISVVLPAYKEEENLRVLLPELEKVLGSLSPDYEIVIVDTMEAMDHSKQVCEKHPKVVYVNREGGNNYGDAIRTGVAKAQGKHIVFMDADGSHTPSFISEMFAEKDNYDLIIASRYIKGGHTNNNPILIAMSWLVNFIYSFVLNLNCKDVSNSFRLYQGEQLKAVALHCNNFDIVEEVLFKLIRRKRNQGGLKIKEIPFTFRERQYGETKRNLFVFILTYIFTLIKLRYVKDR